MPQDPQEPPASPPSSKLLRYYLLLLVLVIVPIALSYGLRPGDTLPRMFDIAVSGTDQIHVFRALMCLYLGAAVFWTIAAFTPAWQRTAVIWGIFFAFSLAIGRAISLVMDGRPSLLLLVYLGLEIVGGLLGLSVLAAADRKLRR
jgi:uncharacterized protein DUF4345